MQVSTERPICHQILVARRAGFGQLTVQMKHGAAASLFVQVVYILSYYFNIILLLEFGQSHMAKIRLQITELPMQPVIEIEYQLRVAHKALRCGHILHPIIVPQSIRITERAHTTFGTDTSTGQHHYFPFHQKPLSILLHHSYKPCVCTFPYSPWEYSQ